MNLTITGHDDRYAVEQLMLSLFPEDTRAQAESTLHRGSVYLTASTRITLDGKTARACRRLRADRETVRLRRQALQQSLYLAAIQLLPELPPWGALAGVRPTKITTRHLLEGGTHVSADRLLRDVYYVTPDRRKLSVDCSQSTVAAAGLLSAEDISLYVLAGGMLEWSETIMSTESCSYDELAESLRKYTPLDDFRPISEYAG